MDNVTLKSPAFNLVLRFTSFKISMPTIHSNSFKMLVVEIQEGLSYISISDTG